MPGRKRAKARMAGRRGPRMGEAPAPVQDRYKCYLLAMRLCGLEEQAKMAHRKVVERDLAAAESFIGGVHAEARLASMGPLAPLSGEFARIGRRAEQARDSLAHARVAGAGTRADVDALVKTVRAVRDEVERAMRAGHEACGA